MMPMEPCGPYPNLGVERFLLGVMWEDLTFKHRGLDDGHTKMLLWRYVDTYVKDVTSGGW